MFPVDNEFHITSAGQGSITVPSSISATPVEGPIDVEEGTHINLRPHEFLRNSYCNCRAGEHHGARQHISHASGGPNRCGGGHAH